MSDEDDCGCRVHPRWCAWNGPCCDWCSHGVEEAHAECCGGGGSVIHLAWLRGQVDQYERCGLAFIFWRRRWVGNA